MQPKQETQARAFDACLAGFEVWQDAGMSDPLPDLLRDAVAAGDNRSFQALAAAGPEAVQAFRDILAGDLKLDVPRIVAAAAVRSLKERLNL